MDDFGLLLKEHIKQDYNRVVWQEVITLPPIHVEQLQVGDFVPGIGKVEWIETFPDHVEVDWIGEGYGPQSWLDLDIIYFNVARTV